MYKENTAPLLLGTQTESGSVSGGIIVRVKRVRRGGVRQGSRVLEGWEVGGSDVAFWFAL